MNLLKYGFAITMALASLESKSQTTYIPQWQAWLRYYNQAQLGEKRVLHIEIDERRRLNPSLQSQFFTHVHLHYRVKPWLDVAAGGSYILANSTVNRSLIVPELRSWQEASLIKKFGKEMQFQFRYRLDERFIHHNDNQVLFEGYHFNWRHRFRVQISEPIVKSNNRTLTLKLSDEVMLNTGDVVRLFDQNRIYASLEMKVNERWSFESGYLNIIQPITDNVFYERHVIRSTVYHRIDARKKTTPK